MRRFYTFTRKHTNAPLVVDLGAVICVYPEKGYNDSRYTVLVLVSGNTVHITESVDNVLQKLKGLE